MTKKKYNKHLKKFRFIYLQNYNGDIYSIDENTKSIRINPIPIIVELIKDEGKKINLQNIRTMIDFTNHDLKILKFKARHASAFDLEELMPLIATSLGIKYGLGKLEAKERKREDGTKGNLII